MFFDPATFLLVLLGLLPGRFRALLVQWSVRRWPWLAGITLVAAAITLAVPGIGRVGAFVAVQLLLLGLFLRLDARALTPHRRFLVQFLVALTWHLWFRSLAPNLPPIEARATAADFWFIDLFVRLWITGMAPLVEGLGLGASLDAIVAYLAPTLRLLSSELLSLHFAWCFIAAGLLRSLLTPDLPSLAHRALRPLRLPAALTALMVALWGVSRLDLAGLGLPPWGGVAVAGYKALVIVHGLAGLGLLRAWAGRFVTASWARVLVAVVCVIGLLHPPWLWAVLALGVVSVTGLHLKPVTATMVGDLHVRGGVVSVMRRYWLLTICLFYVNQMWLASQVDRVPLAVAAPPAEGSARARVMALSEGHREGAYPQTPQAHVTSAEDATFWIDRFEYPNRRGEAVRVGATPAEAEALCAARGQQLCSLEAWSNACSDGGRWHYIFGGRLHKYFSSTIIKEAKRHCNVLESGHADAGTGTVWAAGAGEGCRGRLAVYDLVGNALEWVRIPSVSGLWGLMGSCYLYKDQRLLRCDTPLLVLDGLVSTLDLRSVGFRCCGPEGPLAEPAQMRDPPVPYRSGPCAERRQTMLTTCMPQCDETALDGAGYDACLHRCALTRFWEPLPTCEP